MKQLYLRRKGSIEISALGYIVLGIIGLLIAIGVIFFFSGGMKEILAKIGGILTFGG